MRHALDALVPRFLLFFEVDGRQHSVSRVFALWIVEHLDVVKHSRPCFVTGFVYLAADFFLLQVREEAFRYRIIPTVAAATHARFDVECFK